MDTGYPTKTNTDFYIQMDTGYPTKTNTDFYIQMDTGYPAKTNTEFDIRTDTGYTASTDIRYIPIFHLSRSYCFLCQQAWQYFGKFNKQFYFNVILHGSLHILSTELKMFF